MNTEPRARVLIVDDEPELREAYAALLQHAGYAVETANGGKTAVAILDKEHFDVILTDISMPDMDGLQVLKTVRERDLDVPVVLMTGNPQVETAVQALEQGALRYLMKPIREDALCQTVADAVRLHKLAALKREYLAHLGADSRLVGDRAGLDASFARALASLWMAYQPIVSSPNGSLYGHEALVRTAEPTLPNPGALFDAAERLGRVHELGRAIRASVARSFPLLVPKGQVFVNLHPLDLTDERLFSREDPLSTAATSVVLEITERAVLPPDHRAHVQDLRRLGYRIAIDDLGEGYAGLSTFAALEPEVVKLDMGLVRGVDKEPFRRRIVGSMIDLCKGLGIQVVAEGVEAEEERDTLTHLGCDLLQGFLLGRPETAPSH
jgi:EAL domain-containing protein (putative c-di-GMP-specific phosphodiesterase class I)